MMQISLSTTVSKCLLTAQVEGQLEERYLTIMNNEVLDLHITGFTIVIVGFLHELSLGGIRTLFSGMISLPKIETPVVIRNIRNKPSMISILKVTS